jgi:hypothetical protein
MATVRRNIISNLASGAWIAILTLAITPLQVNILGLEAYGLLGFIATLQMMLSVFDLGLSSTITREIAADHSPGRQRSLPLLRTTATINWAFAVIIGVVLGEPLAASPASGSTPRKSTLRCWNRGYVLSRCISLCVGRLRSTREFSTACSAWIFRTQSRWRLRPCGW